MSLTLIGQSATSHTTLAEPRPTAAAPASSAPPLPSAAPQSNVDLTVTALDTTALVTDSQTLILSGTLGATIKNLGSDATAAQFRVLAFEDRNANGQFNAGTDVLLGSINVSDSIAAGASANLSLALSGTVTFKGNLIYVFVDSENAIAETNENNNIWNTGQSGNIIRLAGPLNPIVKWQKNSFAVQPESNQVMMTPIVIELSGDGIPDIVFITFALSDSASRSSAGILRAISGASGQELWTVTDPAYMVEAYAGIAAGDIDGDGRPEIIASQLSGKLIAFQHDGTFKWVSSVPINYGDANWGSVSIADLDHDGLPEIIFGAAVFNHTGILRWNGNQGRGGQNDGPLSSVADLDLDGNLEVIAGKTAYRSDGSVYWNAPLSDGFTAIGNFDNDPFPEIVLVTDGKLYLLEHTGQAKWGPAAIPGGGSGGAPTVADFDNDGQPEIGVAGASSYVVFETDGSIKWQVSTQDGSSGVTGSSVFDFNGDGSAEAIYGDELFLRIYRGTDGQELYKLPKSSATTHELPVIADVDGNGKAEIVAVANQRGGFGPQTGIYVIGSADNNWVNTRHIWNQHTYHITNVNEDGTIPRNEQPNWLTPGLNNFRLNTFAPGEGNPTGAPDLTTSLIRKNDAAFPNSSELIARIGNGGGAFVPPGVNVSFYNGDPASGGPLIGTTQTATSLNPGQHEDVKVVWNNPPTGLHPITVVADDNGSGQGTVTEGNETNNKVMANIALGIGPFTLVDDLIARFKDGAVDLKWSPITGAAGYNVYRRTGNGAPQLIKQNHPRASYADSALANGTTYYYTVRWVNATGIESGDGTEMSATPTAQSNRNDVPPTILSAPVTRTVANQPYSYDVNARDPNAADALVYSLPTPSPQALQGMTVNPASGLLQWTPMLASAGYQNVTVRVEDSRGRFATQTYRLFVEIPNSPPLANAGPDQTIMATETASLPGTVLDDGLPFGGTLTTSWAKVSGPGAVSFANPGQQQTTATFSAQGTYVLRLTASDSALSSSDEVTINVVRPFASRLYTLNADFDSGNLNNVEHRIPHQLQLGGQAAPFNFIWIAIFTKGTVVKINTETGQVLGEYRTAPEGQPTNPSRTSVDLNGNAWVANRDLNSIVRIGLLENGGCVDRNGNGRIDTSTGLNDIKPWSNANGADQNGGVTNAQDECIINYLRTSAGGTRHLSVDRNNDVWVSGWGGANQSVFNLVDGTTGLIKRTESFGTGGYGGLIDKNGVLWSSGQFSGLLRWDTSKPGNQAQGYNHPGYGLCIDSKGNIWHTARDNNEIRKIASDGTLLGVFGHGNNGAQGCTVDKNDHVWVAHVATVYSGSSPTMGHLRNDGTFVGNLDLGDGPTGAATDAAGKVWATLHNARKIVRINPNAGPIGADGVSHLGAFELSSVDLGGNLYTYSDMTGSTLTGAPNTGTWTVTYDSQIANAEWGRIGWNAQICGDGALIVTAASSTDNTTFSPAQNVTRGQDLTVPDGRYLRISVLFRRATTGESPILYDLSVGTDGYAPPAQTNTPPTVDAGADLTTALFVPVKLKGAACDDGLPTGTLSFAWTKVSGPGAVTFANANALATTATINTPGAYVLRLTASDGPSTVSDDINVTIEGTNSPPVITSTAPASTCSTRPYSYQVIANDPNFGDVLTYSLPTAPVGMTINSATGLIQWTPGAAQTGGNNVTVRVTDLGNNQVEQSFTINVAATPATNTAPTITSTAPTAGVVSLLYTYPAVATDPDPCETLAWSLDVAPAGMTINATTGLIQWTPTPGQTGNQNVTVRVRDFNGASAMQSFAINVVASLQPPTVAISAPAPGSTITQLANIVGTVGDPNGTDGPPVTWKVELRREGSNTYKTIGSGTGPVTNGTLAPFDPTMLANDVYYVRLSAVKGFEYREIEAPYSVMGDLKLGNFTISFTDLTIPVAGLPIVITREYNSLDTGMGEFGAGWRLGLAGRVIDSASETPFEGFRPGTRVYVTRPDGRRVGFTFTPVASGFIGVFPVFTPDPGVYDTLEVNPALLVLSGGTFYEFPGGTYNPQLYFFKTKENVQYAIDEIEGLKQITDINGNTLTVTPTGIVSSTGVAVAFERDAQNRITKITEPAGGAGAPGELLYVYDDEGQLIRKTERTTGRYSEFVYDYRSRLIQQAERNSAGVEQQRVEYVYDALNRRIRAQGNSTPFQVIYDGMNPLLKLSVSGSILSRRMYGPLIDQVFADQSSSSTRWFITDQVGTVRDLVDSDGAVVNHYAYDSFGQLLSLSNSAADNDVLFAGREFGSSGLGYFRFRHYDANTGRFQQEDPISPFQYAYANSNPIIFSDPLGLFTIVAFAARIAAGLILAGVLTSLFPNELDVTASTIAKIIIILLVLTVAIAPTSIAIAILVVSAFYSGANAADPKFTESVLNGLRTALRKLGLL